MNLTILVIGCVLIVCGLMILQLRFLTNYHPNAELLIRFWKLIGPPKFDKNL